MIKQYFAAYHLHAADITIDLATNAVTMLKRSAEPWTVTLVDTGLQTMTGGRIRRIAEHLRDDFFCLTYGDGVVAIDMRKLIRFHLAHGRIATVTAVRPPSRFGTLLTYRHEVTAFLEKPPGGETWINGGFFVLSPRVLEYIDGDATVFEREPLERLAADGELMAFHHEDFWYSMDTMRDKKHLEGLWASGHPPWRVW